MSNVAVIVLDASGSMSGREQQVVSGVNEFMKGLIGADRVMIWLFDSQRWHSHFDGNPKDWREMTQSDYQTDASTPLYDSIAAGVSSVPEDATKVVFHVDTDGYENASREHTKETIKALVERKTAEGWEFKFIGSGDLESQARDVAAQSAGVSMQSYQTTHAARGATYGLLKDEATKSFTR